MVFVGGAFDEAKIDAYRIEIGERISLCAVLPQLIDTLIKRMDR